MADTSSQYWSLLCLVESCDFVLWGLLVNVKDAFYF